jgi:hypothetical protein
LPAMSRISLLSPVNNSSISDTPMGCRVLYCSKGILTMAGYRLNAICRSLPVETLSTNDAGSR